MALARIITGSQAYSRELTPYLLARGYGVEVVSPDKIPDTVADLEIRVDDGPGDQLTASVVIRRSPEPRAATRIPEEPVSFPAEPGVEEVELPAALPQLAPETISVAAETLHQLEFDAEEGEGRISPRDTFLSLPVEPPIQTAEENSTIEQVATRPTMLGPTMLGPTMVPPTREPRPFHRPAEWFRHVGLIFASVILLAAVLGLGMRRSGKPSAQSSGAVSAEKTAAASTDVNWLSAANPKKNTGKALGQVAPPAPPPAIKSQANSDPAPESPVAKTNRATAAETPAASTQARVSGRGSRRYRDDSIAPDTVVYLDKHASAAKAAKSNSDVKPPSNLN